MTNKARTPRRRLLTKSEQMARVRSRNTAPDLALRSALHRLGLRYVLGAKLPGSPDIAFVRQRVAIFVDGCFWHGCPSHYSRPAANAAFWRAKLKRNRQRDRSVDRQLLDLGWRPMRVWEHQVTRDLDVTALQIKYAISRWEPGGLGLKKRKSAGRAGFRRWRRA